MPEVLTTSNERPPEESRVSREADNPVGRVPGGPSETLAAPRSDDRLFRDLMNRFTVLAETCARFSQEVYQWSGTPPEADMEDAVRRNLKIARTVFGRWCLEILAVIHLNRSVTLPDLKRSLGRIGGRTLNAKLRQLERVGLVQRDATSKASPRRRYFLTHKGLMIARLGEPVFLYLRAAAGWRSPSETEEAGLEHPDPASPAIAD